MRGRFGVVVVFVVVVAVACVTATFFPDAAITSVMLLSLTLAVAFGALAVMRTVEWALRVGRHK